jgi:thioester reductase-like protein
MDNAYINSKFISERIVLQAVATHGLSAKVVRVGNLAPRSTDGEFQINFQTNSAMGRVRAFKILGGYTYEECEQPMEFSPINEVARAIVLLSGTPKACCLFHPFNNHSVLFDDVMNELKVIGEPPRLMEEEEFVQQLNEAKNDPQKAPLLTGLLAYEDMSHGQRATFVPTINHYTTAVLLRLGFRWSPTSWNYVDSFLVAISRLGFFN